LHSLRQHYLNIVSQETPEVPRSLCSVVAGEINFDQWLTQVGFVDAWLVEAAKFTLSVWQADPKICEGEDKDRAFSMPRKRENTPYDAPKALRININYEWMPDKGQSWSKFRQAVIDEVEGILQRYRVETERKWRPPGKQPVVEDLRLLALYQANKIRNPSDARYKRLRRAAAHLGLTLRAKNNRTKLL
jgi:hypothetical protein